MAEKQLEVIQATRQEIISREQQASEAVARLTESLQSAENIQPRSALLAWVHESIARSGKLNIQKFKSGTYATAEVRQQKIAAVQVELKKAKAELKHSGQQRGVVSRA